MRTTRPYLSFIAAATTLTAAGCASLPIVTNRSSGTHGNQPVDTELVIRPDVAFYAESWQNYLHDRGSVQALDASIENCRSKPESCAKLFQAWVKTIDFINEVPPELRLQKASLALVLISAITSNDAKKGTFLNALFHSGHWLQTPAETLVTKKGAGVCGDLSVLLYETALRTGTSPSDISLIGGVEPSGSFHTVPAITVDGQRYIMDPNIRLRLYDGDDKPLASPILAKYDNYLNGVTIEGKIHTSRFFPLVEMNEAGTRVIGNFFNIVAAPFRAGGKPDAAVSMNSVFSSMTSQSQNAAMIKTGNELIQLMSAVHGDNVTKAQKPTKQPSPMRK